MIRLLPGDCRSVLRDLPDASVHCCVTDPPYGLEFMGKEWDAPWNGSAWQSGAGFSKPGIGERKTAWPTFTGGNDEFGGANPTCAKCGGRARGKKKCDCAAPDWRVKGAAPDRMYGRQRQMQTYQAWCEDWAREVLRVLKPGGHLVAFGGTRTSHRMACAIEDAGFEIRDTLCWLYGSGFPKSHDVSKAIDRAAGAVREVVGPKPGLHSRGDHRMADGWHRPWMDDADAVARGMSETAPATSDAQRWQGWGTALKPAHEPIILARKPLAGTVAANVLAHGTGAINVDACRIEANGRPLIEVSGDLSGGVTFRQSGGGGSKHAGVTNLGRWPANVLHDGSDEVEAAFAAFGERASCNSPSDARAAGLILGGTRSQGAIYPGDHGSASRFFYSAKATAADRADSRHPTVKPVELMRWLVRLVTPPGGTVLDPFAGSGTTGEAAMLCGFDAVLIEQDAQHVADIRHRMDRWSGHDAPLFASPPPAEDPEDARMADLFAEAAE